MAIAELSEDKALRVILGEDESLKYVKRSTLLAAREIGKQVMLIETADEQRVFFVVLKSHTKR